MTSYKTNKKLSVTQSFSFFKTNRSRWMMQKQQEENGDLEKNPNICSCHHLNFYRILLNLNWKKEKYIKSLQIVGDEDENIWYGRLVSSRNRSLEVSVIPVTYKNDLKFYLWSGLDRSRACLSVLWQKYTLCLYHI